ncbi:histidine kinase [Bifidobacterium anseris]|uniref:Histidine kinase n=2 Tax=Bifidobacterium anseris TaxID=2020963 RepID=A0A2N5IYH4_9BIFI|nr:ATP-binding protein [Bifidobacterium anseris]PLS27009.1 histidine kinase [Bifidobacterium anseris]
MHDSFSTWTGTGGASAARAAADRPLYPARLPLMRPRKGRWIAGVARGVSMHLGVPVVWVRLAFVVLCALYGVGLGAYVALWLLIPAGDPEAEARRIAAVAHAADAPLAKGNARPGAADARAGIDDAGDYDATDYTGLNSAAPTISGESLKQLFDEASKPALFASLGVLLIACTIVINMAASRAGTILPAALAVIGLGIAWMRYNAPRGQVMTTAIGVALEFVAYVVFLVQPLFAHREVTLARSLVSGLLLVFAVIGTLTPWIMALMRGFTNERALKEREEERADMTAHLHDGVLQTLALIQLHAAEPQTVFTLARSQERELRSWLYQERTTSDRSVKAGLTQIAAQIEDSHGKPIDVVTVGDARPSAQTDALLDAAAQAMVNAVTHGGEPVSVYCEASDTLVEVFVRDHGDGFRMEDVPPERLGIRESIIGRIRRRGGSVEIVSRLGWGTEVRMHMPIAAHNDARAAQDDAKETA